MVGRAGVVGRNWVERTDGTIDEFGATGLREMAPGDVFVIETPGGGGFGTAGQKPTEQTDDEATTRPSAKTRGSTA